MTDAVYWDTSALLKLYAPEADSSDYFRLLIAQPEDIAICFLHRVELYYALVGKQSRGEIAAGSAQQLFHLFEKHLAAGRYYQIPWGEDVANGARELLDESRGQVPPVPLRSRDGLHLGALSAAGIRSVVTADARMRDAAQAMSIHVVVP